MSRTSATPATSTPIEPHRRLFLLGLGLYSAIALIAAMLAVALLTVRPHQPAIAYIGAFLTVFLTIVDSLFLRFQTRTLLPDEPGTLAAWPVRIVGYPSWVYRVEIVIACLIVIFMLVHG